MSEAKFRELLTRHGIDATTVKELKSEAFAKWLDEKDDLAHFRNEFHYPPSKSSLSLVQVNQAKIPFTCVGIPWDCSPNVQQNSCCKN